MSAMEATSEFTEYLAGLGIPTGKNTDGSDNLVIAAAYGMFKAGMRQQKMNVLCPACGGIGELDEEPLPGQHVLCPFCGTSILS